jgi:hypothetical protein
MFGHLKPEDFTNLIEGVAIPPRRQKHLGKCGRCAEEWKTLESIHLSIAGGSPDDSVDDIIEPDWSEFRASVREEMLSRSARRSVENHRWSLSWRFAPVGISLSAALVAGLFASRFLLTPPPITPGNTTSEVRQVFTFDDESIEVEKAVWGHASALDDVVSLSPEESERFRELLESETGLSADGESPEVVSP